MGNEVSELNWTDILNKFAVYKGPIIDFCKENNIKHYQLYHQRKKLKKAATQTFHAIELKKDEAVKNEIIAAKDIRIEIGNVNIYIPIDDKASILNIIKELEKSC
jgi:hypothetical protein